MGGAATPGGRKGRGSPRWSADCNEESAYPQKSLRPAATHQGHEAHATIRTVSPRTSCVVPARFLTQLFDTRANWSSITALPPALHSNKTTLGLELASFLTNALWKSRQAHCRKRFRISSQCREAGHRFGSARRSGRFLGGIIKCLRSPDLLGQLPER